MEDLSKKIVMVVDTCNFLEFAVKLSNDFGRVFYYCPNIEFLVKSPKDLVGDGIPEIIRVKGDSEFWRLVDSGEIDLFVFPDVYMSGLQVHLRDHGHLVFGMGRAEFLELDRWKSRLTQERLGLPVPRTERVVGVDNLQKKLESIDDTFVKISNYRGDAETYHHIKKTMSGEFIDKLNYDLGYSKDTYEFILEQSIEGVEAGYDGWTSDGQFPVKSMYGYEVKDLAYVGKIVNDEDIPVALTLINNGLSSIFHENTSRGFFSTEIRVGNDRVPYLIDPCMRCGEPPSEGNIENLVNLGEVVWEVANGRNPIPVFEKKFLAMIMIGSVWAESNWMKVNFPSEYKRFIKLNNYMIDSKGEYCIVPMKRGEQCNIGSIIGLGDTLESAIKNAKEISEKVKGYDIMVEESALDKAQEVIDEGRGYGIDF